MSGHVSARRQGKTPAWRRLPYDVSSITQADPFGQICQKAKIPEKGLKKSLKFAWDSSSFRDQRLIPDTSGHLSRSRTPRAGSARTAGNKRAQDPKAIPSRLQPDTGHVLHPHRIPDVPRPHSARVPGGGPSSLRPLHTRPNTGRFELHPPVTHRRRRSNKYKNGGGGINSRAFFYFLTVFVFLFNFLTNI